MVGGDDVGVGGDAQAGSVGAASLESVDFLKQGFEVDDDTVAQDWGGVFGEYTCRQQLEFVFFTADDDGVAGVVTTVGFDDVVDEPAEDVCGFAFSFVAPLGTDDDDCGHYVPYFACVLRTVHYLTMLILRCGQAVCPVESVDLPAVPGRRDLRVVDDYCAQALPEDPTPSLDEMFRSLEAPHQGEPGPAPQAEYVQGDPRIVVVGSDAALSAVLTRLMRRDSLWMPVAWVPDDVRSPAAVNFGIVDPWSVAFEGTVRPAPCIRDDAGVVVAGQAEIAVPVGEVVVDSQVLVSKVRKRRFFDAPAVARLVPLMGAPGIAATAVGRRGNAASSIKTGRAVQAGGSGLLISVDGVPRAREVDKVTFYRHVRDLQIVRPGDC